jgi:hypothetical protein
MKRDAANQLDVIMALAKGADGRLADRGEGLGKEAVELFAFRQPLAEALGLGAQIVVAQRGNLRLERVDRVDIFAKPADIAIVGRSEEALCQCGDLGNPLKTRAIEGCEKSLAAARKSCAGDVSSAPSIVN